MTHDTSETDRQDALVSIVTPAFQEVESVEELHRRISEVMGEVGLPWEWVVVDDHSSDGTYKMLCGIGERDPHVKAIRLARNSGAHMALTCALRAAAGDCTIALAADLQDPPEIIPQLLEQWRAGHDIVWAVRGTREGESATKIGSSRVYYWIMRKVVGLEDLPATGADCFLIGRRALDAFCDFRETNVSVLALLNWIGFRQTHIVYAKHARARGSSGWTLRKKLKLLVDSVTAFSHVPIRMMSYLGFVVAAVGFLYAIVVIINAFVGEPPQGWTALIVIVLVIGGILMLMLGVLGEYLWRSLDESRKRPQFIVETTHNIDIDSATEKRPTRGDG